MFLTRTQNFNPTRFIQATHESVRYKKPLWKTGVKPLWKPKTSLINNNFNKKLYFNAKLTATPLRKTSISHTATPLFCILKHWYSKRFCATLSCATCVKRNEWKIGVLIENITKYMLSIFKQNRSKLYKNKTTWRVGGPFFGPPCRYMFQFEVSAVRCG